MRFRIRIGAGIVVSLLAGCSSAGDRATPPALPETEGHVVTDDGIHLFYRMVGNGPRVVVVPADIFLYPALRELAEGRTLVFYDMRNRGRSDSVSATREVSIQRDVADLENLRAGLHLESFDLVGWSYLGLMVALYTLDHPDHVRRLVQIGPVPMRFGTLYPAGLGPEDYQAALDTSAVAELRRLRSTGYHEAHPRDYCDEEWAVTRVALVGNPVNAERLQAKPCESPNEWPTAFERHLARHLPSVERVQLAASRVATLDKPTLVIHGTRDRNAPYGGGREWAHTLPNARLLTIEGAAHCPWADEPERVVSSIRTFLDGEWPPGVEVVETLERPVATGK